MRKRFHDHVPRIALIQINTGNPDKKDDYDRK